MAGKGRRPEAVIGDWYEVEASMALFDDSRSIQGIPGCSKSHIHRILAFAIGQFDAWHCANQNDKATVGTARHWYNHCH